MELATRSRTCFILFVGKILRPLVTRRTTMGGKMLLGEEVFARVVSQTSPRIILRGGDSPCLLVDKAKGLFRSTLLTGGFPVWKDVLMHQGGARVCACKPSGKNPPDHPPAPARCPRGCGAGEPGLSLCCGSGLERRSYC